MRKFYQESWQGIPFSAFTHVSFFHLANAEFYATFYEELFRRFHCWDCLPAAWRMGKDRGARWIAEQIQAQAAQSSVKTESDACSCPQNSTTNLTEHIDTFEGVDTDARFDMHSDVPMDNSTGACGVTESLGTDVEAQETVASQMSGVFATTSAAPTSDNPEISAKSVAFSTSKELSDVSDTPDVNVSDIYHLPEVASLPDVTRLPNVHEADEHDVINQEAACSCPRVLSIGSGVGYLEKSLLDIMPDIELHVNEPNTAGLRWLKEVVPLEHIYIGSPSTCLPPDVQYQVIYLSAIDYSFTNEEFAFALQEIKAQLAPGGRLLCLSSSLLEEYSGVGSAVNIFKIGLRAVLHFLGVRRQQFWGWRRTQEEYHQFFENAGFKNIQDGWLDDGFHSYWISGE